MTDTLIGHADLLAAMVDDLIDAADELVAQYGEAEAADVHENATRAREVLKTWWNWRAREVGAGRLPLLEG